MFTFTKHAPAPFTPETLIVREHPPAPPQSYPTTVITIPGKTVEPPPRKVIIEKLAPLPSKPQPIIIERWSVDFIRFEWLLFKDS